MSYTVAFLAGTDCAYSATVDGGEWTCSDAVLGGGLDALSRLVPQSPSVPDRDLALATLCADRLGGKVTNPPASRPVGKGRPVIY